jgi:tripartite-type tricarboxylate transporter receptor subunit TctC
MLSRNFGRSLVLAAALCIAAPFASQAQDFPSKPVTVIVPFGAGGVTDLFARQVVEKLEPLLGQQVIVENKPGQGGSLGPRAVADADPDGYTLSLIGSGNAIGQTLYENLTYSLTDDFAPVVNLVELTNVLIVNPEVEADSVQELIDLAKENPGELKFASSGSGGVYHLDMEMFRNMADIDVLHVPFRTEPEGRTDVIAGRSDAMITAFGVAQPNIAAGQLKALGVTGSNRFPELPDVPTISEAGLPGFAGNAYIGLVAPAGTPPERIEILRVAFVEAINDPEFKAKIAKQGMAVVDDQTSEGFDQYIKDEVAKWKKVIEDAGIEKRS